MIRTRKFEIAMAIALFIAAMTASMFLTNPYFGWRSYMLLGGLVVGCLMAATWYGVYRLRLTPGEFVANVEKALLEVGAVVFGYGALVLLMNTEERFDLQRETVAQALILIGVMTLVIGGVVWCCRKRGTAPQSTTK
jgi:hypothetical protein